MVESNLNGRRFIVVSEMLRGIINYVGNFFLLLILRCKAYVVENLSRRRLVHLTNGRAAMIWCCGDQYRYIHIFYYFFTSPAINTLRPWRNGQQFADDIFKSIFLNESVWISIKISLTFVPRDQINNVPALVHIMAWHRPRDKPLPGPMMVNLLKLICVTLHQWVTQQYYDLSTRCNGKMLYLLRCDPIQNISNSIFTICRPIGEVNAVWTQRSCFNV